MMYSLYTISGVVNQ